MAEPERTKRTGCRRGLSRWDFSRQVRGPGPCQSLEFEYCGAKPARYDLTLGFDPAYVSREQLLLQGCDVAFRDPGGRQAERIAHSGERFIEKSRPPPA